MRAACLFAALVACGPRTSAVAPAHTQQAAPPVPRLVAPPAGDPDARGATYLASVALALQPTWHQFLEDCRLRLPATHPLNEMTLAATAEIEVDEKGFVEAIKIGSSGNKDFDRAARQVVLDASPLPVPPRELWSDDDHVHLVWMFARDRRQAGPATAQVSDVELPLHAFVHRMITQKDLSRAARRIGRAKAGPERELATQNLMHAALREAVGNSGSIRQAAVEAIGRAGAIELLPLVRVILEMSRDSDLRIAATTTVARMRDADSVEILVEQLRVDLQAESRLAVDVARALHSMGRADAAESVIAGALQTPSAVALMASAFAPSSAQVPLLQRSLRDKSARIRAAACTALGSHPSELATVTRATRDRDATVRAACVDAVRASKSTTFEPALKRIRELSRDRDSLVRAAAVRAIAHLDPDSLVSFADDRASEVRLAYAEVLALTGKRTIADELRKLIDDRDPDVRAAAWTTLVAQAPLFSDRATLAQRAATDSAPQVRRAALPALGNEDALLRLATLDDDSDVRTAAMVELASRRGRTGSAALLLERLADASPGSAERVRTALAWLVAR